MTEIRNIPGFTGYGASADGRVWSRWRRGRSRAGQLTTLLAVDWRELRQKTHFGYQMVALTAPDGKQVKRRAHRLVLMAFVGQPLPWQECRHLNGNGTDNRLENLAWGTSKENAEDRARHGTVNRGARNGLALLDENEVAAILRAHKGGSRIGELAREYGVSRATIQLITAGKTWKHVTAKAA